VKGEDKIRYLIGETANNNDTTFVELQAHCSIYGALTRRDGTGDELAFGSEEVTIVKNTAEFDGDELIAKSANIAVKRETFDVHMCNT